MCGKKKRHGWLSAALLGAGFSTLLSGAMIGLLAWMIMQGRVGEWVGERSVYALELIGIVMGIKMVTLLWGIGEVRIPIMAGGAYAMITVIIGLFLEGKYGNVWPHILAVLIACLISCSFCIRKKGRKKK